MTEPPAARSLVGYRIALPPGWAQIPLRSGTEEAIQSILDLTAADLPTEAAQRREPVAAALRNAAALARESRGVHLYLPIRQIYGRTVAASFVVAEVAFGALDPVEPALLVARLAAEPSAKRVIVEGVACSRAESTHPAEPSRGAPLPSRRVDYVLPVPNDPDRWVVVSFSALRQGEAEPDLSAAWVELFDAIMSTFRWSRPRCDG